MPSILLSGPAGSGKSQEARRLRASNPGPAVIADFQSLYAAIAGDVRGPDGTFPLRDPSLLPTAEHTRRVVISAARARGLDVIATNSDGDRTRRRRLLDLLGPGASERIIDPGRDVVIDRLADSGGTLSGECNQAVGRWYDRI